LLAPPPALANLETARAGISGYSTSVGFDMQVRITATTTDATRNVVLFRLPGTLDSTYTPSVSTLNFNVTDSLSGSVLEAILSKRFFIYASASNTLDFF
jgi:hypothetical protein